MTEPGQRSGAPRDVPPPRPVEGEVLGGPAADSGLGSAARALADAVAGLLGGGAGGAAKDGSDRSGGAGKVLTDVIAAVAGAARGPGRDAGTKGGASGTGRRTAPGGLLTDLLDAAAPRLPVRDRARLRQAYPGVGDEQIADALVARAARLTGGIGAASGGLAAAQWFTPPTLLAMPLELGAQTVLVAAVEVVLIGELHELYGRPAPGDARQRAAAYLASWTTQRAVGSTGRAGVIGALGAAGVRSLRRQVTKRLARSTTSAAPLLVGAALAARGNRKGTATLADRVRADLRTALPRGRR
ncbi:hypothetical protein [Modestobacter sp. NPDC049651]|uniref:hypothetical protein n=1 Tax=unclassified Modestobacter TaxID=2643866 RepID=UPI0033EC5330